LNIAIWNNRYVTGIEVIDAQHQSLFAAVNEVAESFKSGTSHERVRVCMALRG
jgi:hemerythrin